MRTVYETNVFGPVRVLRAFIPLLEKSSAPVVVNVSSGVGSLNLAADPESPLRAANFPVYASSKAALNMLTVQLAYLLRETAIKVNSADPGYPATDLSGRRGTQTIPEGAAEVDGDRVLGRVVLGRRLYIELHFIGFARRLGSQRL